MDDRELLELAAKAAGIKVKGVYEEENTLLIKAGPGLLSKRWNPFTDDGDALRLAVALEMSVDRVGNEVVVAHSNGFERERSNDDIYAATRRAIVKAAAEIGKNK